MTGNLAMDDGSRCLLDVIGDPSALQSFLEGGGENHLKSSPNVSLDESSLQVDFSIRTNGTHFHASPSLLKQAAAAVAIGNCPPFQVSSTQTVSSGVCTQAVSSTQAPSPAYQQPVASPRVGHSPLSNQNAGSVQQQQQQSPSPAPSPFSVPSRSPAQSIPCPSPSTLAYPPSQSPVAFAQTVVYQTKSPVQAPSPLPHHAPQSKSPATGVVLPQPSPSPTLTPVLSPQQTLLQQPTAVAQALSLAPAQTPVVQFVSATAPILTQSTGRNMKPIQPKQPHLLPKPAGAANGMQFGAGVGKNVAPRNHPVTVAPSPQTNQIVIGHQNQATVLPNANMAMAGPGGGTFLFNHISLGLAQNPILIQGNAGGLQNLQLVVRPQQNANQQSVQGTAAGSNTAAVLAALQVQNQAAHQALLHHAKGQAMVIPTSNNLIATAQHTNTLAKPNVIMNTGRMVNTGQGLQLQQIQTPQGPITLAITPQQLRSLQTVGGANLTLGGQSGTVLQGVTLSQAQLQGTTGVVVNRQALPSLQQEVSMPQTDIRQAQTSKMPGLNLEELLKQAGIVPADPRPAPMLTHSVVTTQAQNVVVTQPQQAVILNSGAMAATRTSNSQLLTQLQQSIALNAQQTQVKLSIAQDGSVYLQRPMVQSLAPGQLSTGTAPVAATDGNCIPSVLMQRLNAAPAHHMPMPTTSNATMTDGNPSLIPLTVQNLNLSSSPTVLGVTTQQSTTQTTATILQSGGGGTGNMATTVLSTVPGLIQGNPTMVHQLTTQHQQPAVSTSVLAQALSQKVAVTQAQQNAILAAQMGQLMTTTMAGQQSAVLNTAAPIANGSTGVVKSEGSNVVLTGSPITSIPPGQKLQTIQLSPQNQENLQKIQVQLRNLMSLKTQTPQQRQMVQQLQSTQQKILAQGKVIAIQQAPASAIQLIQHQQQQQQLQQQQQQQQQHQQVQQQMATMQQTNATPVGSTNNSSNLAKNNNVHLSNLLKNSPANRNSTNITTQVNTPPTSNASAVAMPTQIKVGSQVVTLTPQQRQTFQHLQQQLKTLTPEQQQLYLSQNKQAVILKLQQQKQPTQTQNSATCAVTSSTVSATMSQPTPIAPAPPAIAMATNSGIAGGLLVIQTFGKGITQVKSIVPAIVQEQQNRGVKRPAPIPTSQGSPLQEQLASDQNCALKPDCKTPFRSVKDACRRLLKYHVFNKATPSPTDLRNADEEFETLSEQLLQKARQVFNTYHCLLLQEGMREHPSAELLMLNRMFVENEKESLECDRMAVKEGKDLNLPPLPEHWLHKMDAVSESETEADEEPVSACMASTLTSTSTCSTTLTTVHSTPLSSPKLVCDDVTTPRPVKKEKEEEAPSEKTYDEWAEIQKELEMYPLDATDAASNASVDFEIPAPVITRSDVEVNEDDNLMRTCQGGDAETMMDAEWDEDGFMEAPHMSESEAAVESILLTSNGNDFEDSRTVKREPVELNESFSSSSSNSSLLMGGDEGTVRMGSDSKLPDSDLNAQVESAINSILHLHPEEYMDGDYELLEEELDAKETRGLVGSHNNNMDYEAAISLDTPGMDAALEEAVKSIM